MPNINNLTAELNRLKIRVKIAPLLGDCFGIINEGKQSALIYKIAQKIGFKLIQPHEYFYTYKQLPRVDLIIY